MTSLFPDIEDLFGRMNSALLQHDAKYPPTNVYVEKSGDQKKLYFEFALAGHSKDDIDVYIDGDTLTVESKTSTINSDEQKIRQYFKQSLAKRKFKCQYVISRNYFNLDEPKTEFKDGILKIEFPSAEQTKVKYLTF